MQSCLLVKRREEVGKKTREPNKLKLDDQGSESDLLCGFMGDETVI